jgi:hypothetical protein
MIKILLKNYCLWIVLVLLIYVIGCDKVQSPLKPKPTIKKVLVDSDLSMALGINMIKYEYNLSGFEIPAGKLVYMTAWLELLQEEEKIREWKQPNIVVTNSGTILFAYYKPPFFTNDHETIEAKIIIENQAWFNKNISLDMPFRIQKCTGGFNEETIEMDREYTLTKILEIYSPLNKNTFPSEERPNRDNSENKALILKVKFGLVEK